MKSNETKIRELLDGDYWIPTLETKQNYRRSHDDNDGDLSQDISVIIGEDGDAHVMTNGPYDGRGYLRFRHGIGGGRSLRVRNALLILAEAIRLDNEEDTNDRQDLR